MIFTAQEIRDVWRYCLAAYSHVLPDHEEATPENFLKEIPHVYSVENPQNARVLQILSVMVDNQIKPCKKCGKLVIFDDRSVNGFHEYSICDNCDYPYCRQCMDPYSDNCKTCANAIANIHDLGYEDLLGG